MLCKSAIINLVAIMEAMILEAAACINDYCKKCPLIDKCKSNFSKIDRHSMKTALKKFCDLELLSLDNEEKNFLLQLYRYRDRIHIRLSGKNEFIDDVFNRNLYNKSVKYVNRVCDLLYEEAFPFYGHCIEHREDIEIMIAENRQDSFVALDL